MLRSEENLFREKKFHVIHKADLVDSTKNKWVKAVKINFILNS